MVTLGGILGSFWMPWGGILVTLGGPWAMWNFSGSQGVALVGPGNKRTRVTVASQRFLELGGVDIISKKPVSELLANQAPQPDGPTEGAGGLRMFLLYAGARLDLATVLGSSQRARARKIATPCVRAE